jgi:hypothetical protein
MTLRTNVMSSRQIVTWSDGAIVQSMTVYAIDADIRPCCHLSYLRQKIQQIKLRWVRFAVHASSHAYYWWCSVTWPQFPPASPTSQTAVRKLSSHLPLAMKPNRSRSSPTPTYANKLARNPANNQWMPASKDTLPLLPCSRDNPRRVTGIANLWSSPACSYAAAFLVATCLYATEKHKAHIAAQKHTLAPNFCLVLRSLNITYLSWTARN